MLHYSMMLSEGILILKPRTPLRKEDFSRVSAAVGTYLAEHPKLNGVMIQAKEFPGWQDFDGFQAHLKFVREHRDRVERVAVVTDGSFANVAEVFGKTLTSAEIKHFPYSDVEESLEWLEDAGGPERLS
jgi:hypothetical protein